MLRQEFERSLIDLHQDLYLMGQSILSQLNQTSLAFQQMDRQIASEIIRLDQDINNQELNLETKSIELIALQHPVASDLRRIITVLKASSDIERMGDHLRSIAKSVLYLSETDIISEIVEPINEILEYLSLLLRETFETFEALDPDKAIAISAWDEKVNQMYQKTQDFLTDYIKNNPESINQGREYYQILLHLERLGDYAKNICEWIVYLRIGKIVQL